MKAILALALACALLSFLPAQPPAWAELERGQVLYQQRDYPEALAVFLRLRERQPFYPEAEYWIGRVYQDDRNLALAIQQYIKAINLKQHLYEADTVYPVYYHLADLYRRTGESHMYEQVLLEVTQAELYPDEKTLQQEADLVEQLKNSGLDVMIYSQDLRLWQSEYASLQLGLHYYAQGLYHSAIAPLSYSVISVLNKALDLIQRQNPGFSFPLEPEKDLLRSAPFSLFQRVLQDLQFLQLEVPMSYDQAGLQAALKTMRTIDRHYRLSATGFLLDYLQSSAAGRTFSQDKQIYQSLYYLAAALWASKSDSSAQQIWQILRYRSEAPHWQSKAIAQLLQPFVDPDPLP